MTAAIHQSSLQQQHEQQPIERIYVGGLNPDRLSPNEVVARIESSLTDEIELVSSCSPPILTIDDNDKTYFHVNVRRIPQNNNEDDDDSTALEIIAKKYHNVIWKGSKLRIEAAKPHFLERLARERAERQKRRQEASNNGSSTLVPTSSNVPPRHLRIRRRYGQEAYQVDTKPIAVDEWTVFSKAVAKMHKRQEKQREKATMKHGSALVRKKVPHRAVHLRFLDDRAGEKVAAGGTPQDRADTSSEDDESSSSDSLASTQSSSSKGSSDSYVQKNGKKPYVWSDDESESEQNFPRNADVGALLSESEKNPEGAYSWSSSEESDEHEHSQPTQKHEPRLAPQVDEFSAAVDFFSPDEESDSSSPGGKDDGHGRNVDLHDDVKSNLDVLSSLYPEMSRTAPKDIPVRGDADSDQDHPGANLQPGWENQRGASLSAGLGTMQRFDPTKETARKYELEPISKSTREQDSDSDQEEASDKSHDEHVEEINGHRETAESSSGSEVHQDQNIYQEGKLEDVFREARERAGDHAVVSQGGGGGFTFGFDLGDIEEDRPGNRDAAANNADVFAISFDVGGRMAYKLNEVDEANAESPLELVAERNTNEPAEKKSIFRRRGLLFPRKALQEYTDAFFALNEGARIAEDLDGFRNDDEIKQIWIKERYGLTQDWKRKRKYAQSRMQKKRKYR
jgi:hypothetical protein